MYVDWQLAPFFIECHKTKAKVNTTVNQNRKISYGAMQWELKQKTKTRKLSEVGVKVVGYKLQFLVG